MNSSDRRAPIRYVLIIVGVAGAAVLAARAFLIRRAPRKPLSGIPAADLALPGSLPTPKNAPLMPEPAAAVPTMRPQWQHWLITHRLSLALLGIVVLGTGMGLLFAGTTSTLRNWGDGLSYWGLVQATHDSICADAGYCTPTGTERYDLIGVIRQVIYKREGIMPALFGVLLTILPNEHNTIYFFHFLMLGVSSALITHLIYRAKFPLWVALLAGLLNVTYIPAVINSMTIFQQPFIRFTLILSIWGYGMAFTATKPFTRWGGIGVGAAAAFFLGMGSLTTRPMMWVIPGFALILGPFQSSRWALLRSQIVFLMLQIGCLMWIYQTTMNATPLANPADVNAYLLLGMSPNDSNLYLTTVRSFPDFWAPSEWGIMSIPSRSQSLWGDFAEAPFEFVRWFNFSLFSNWRYPDHTFLQGFILSLAGQHIQHTLLLVLGVIGLAFWAGMVDTKRIILILFLLCGAFLTIIYAVISVEPRRFSVLMPFVIAGAAIGFYAFRIQSPHSRWRNLLLLLLVLGVWSLPLGVVKTIFPISALGALIVLTLIRVGVSWVGLEQLLQGWRTEVIHAGWGFPRLILSGVLVLLLIAQFQDQEWRVWNAPIETTVRQEVTDLRPVEGMFPWLLIDNDSFSLLRETQITINGQILKPVDIPMHIWEAGPAGIWYPYVDILLMSRFPPRRMWYAFPIPEALINTDSLTITLETQGVPIVLRGDYANGDQRAFDGPSFEPWMSGHSFWRWQWNGDDPRIPRLQTLNGHYTSSILEGDQWFTGDLSPEFGRQDGVYRIFVVWSPIGSETNAIAGPGQRFYNVVVCPDGWAAQLGLVACKESEGAVSFYAEGGLVGTAPASVFQPMTEPNKLLYQIKGTLGRVDVFQVMNYTYLANYYLPSGEFYYSLVFEKPPS